MRNEVIYDKNGRPDIMVVFTPSELGLPDTLRGRKVKEYAISKYPNTLIDGVPYSLPFMKPAVNISHDEAILREQGRRLAPDHKRRVGGSRLLELGQRHHADRKHRKRQESQPPGADRHYIRRRLRQDVDRIRPGSVEP